MLNDAIQPKHRSLSPPGCRYWEALIFDGLLKRDAKEYRFYESMPAESRYALACSAEYVISVMTKPEDKVRAD